MSIGTAVLLHDGIDEGEWLAVRRGVITATAAAAIAGSHPYYSLLQVWEEQTNPDWDADAARNAWLDMYAANGHVAEPRIIEWASDVMLDGGGRRHDFQPSHELVGRAEDIEAGLSEPAAATPDGWRERFQGLELIEAKTAQKDWAPPPEDWDQAEAWVAFADEDVTAVPQHVQDQCEWQLYVTGADRVWIALEVTKWTGRGTNKVAEVIGRRLIEYVSNPARRAFLIQRVEWFRGLKAEGIAPESDVDLRDLDPFHEDRVAVTLSANLDRLAAIDDEVQAKVADLLAEREQLVAKVKAAMVQFEGRRVHGVGSRYTAKLVRSFRKKEDTAKLPESERRAITSWIETETLKIEPTPEES